MRRQIMIGSLAVAVGLGVAVYGSSDATGPVVDITPIPLGWTALTIQQADGTATVYVNGAEARTCGHAAVYPECVARGPVAPAGTR